MDVTADGDGCIDGLDITFLHEEFLDHFTESFEVCLWEVLAASDDR
jgi:hypothetical protein